MTRCIPSGIGALLLSLCVVTAYHPEYNHVGGDWHSSSFGLNTGHQNRMSRDTRRLEVSDLLGAWLYQRELTIGDFQDLNNLYQDTTIPLPNTTLTGTILGADWNVDITYLRCQKLSIGDLQVSYARGSNQLATITLDAIEVDFTCLLDYQYSYLFFDGGGQATAVTDNNYANISVAFTSNDFDQNGPTGLMIPACAASFNFADLNFDGNGLGLVSRLLNVVEPLMKRFIKEKTETFACEALSKLNASATELLQSVTSLLEPYLNETSLSESTFTEAELLQNATNITLLSYQDPNGTLASAVGLLIKEAGSFLGGETSSNSSSSGRDLNVNDLIRSYVLDEDGSLSFNGSSLAGAINNGTLLNGGGAFTQTLLQLDSIRIIGLDTFTRFNFTTVENYTLQASFTLASLSLEAEFFWEIQAPDATSSSPSVTENLLVQLDLGQIEVTASLLAAIDQGLLGSLPLGSLLNTSEILDCLISIFYDTDITNLDVMVGDIGQPTVSGFQSSPGLARVTNLTFYAVYDMYHAVLQRAIPGFFQKTVRNMLSKLIRERLQNSHCQPPNISNSSNALIDLRDLLLPPKKALAMGGSGTSPYGGLASFIKEFIDTQLLSINNATGLPNINDMLIARLTKDQSGTEGTFKYNGDLLSLDRTVEAEGLYAKINVQVNDARLENFVVGEPLAFLDPVLGEPYVVNNTASLGANESLPLQLRAHVLFNLQGRDDFEINDEVALGVDIHGTNVLATALLELSEERFLQFPLSDFFNLHCWLATIPAPVLDAQGVRVAGTEPTAGLKALDVSTGKVDFNVSCLNCTGESVFQTLSENLQKEQGSQDASKSANRLIKYAISFLGGGFLQVQLDRMIAQAPSKCPHHPSYNPLASSVQYQPFETKTKTDSIGFLVGLLVATACLIVVTFVLSLVIGAIVRRRHRQWLQRLPQDHVLLIYRQQSLEQQNEKKLNEFAHSMFRSPVIPLYARLGVPVIVLANVAMFLSGHLSIAGTVSIRAEFAGQVLVVDDFYEFSIVQTAVELWNAGGKVLAILIFLFSGVWPYTKQFATLAMWFLPPRWLPLSRRGSLFGWLDLLAKWSVVDIFFMILSLVAFRVTIASPRLSYLPANFYKVDLLVIPLWGLYANLVAQLVSQVSAHFIVHYHRRTVAAAKRDQKLQEQEPNNGREDGFEQPSQQSEAEVEQVGQENPSPDRLQDHAFTRPHRGETDKLKVRPWVPFLVCVVALVASVLVIVGCILSSLSFDAQGIVGVLIRAGNGFQKNGDGNSVFSIVGLLWGEAVLLDTAKDYVGMLSIAVLFVITTFAIPLIQALLLVAQFLLPHAQKTRSRLAVAIEVLQDWQYVDVYVISILITTSQLGNVSAYLVNPYCESLKDALSSLVFYGLLEPDDAQCFYVQAGIDSGTYVLLAAAVLLTVLHTFVTKALAQYRRDKAAAGRELAEEDRIYSSTDDDEVAKAIERVHPAPVLFTDNFRWLLQREIPRPPKTSREETFDEEADFVAGASREDLASM